MIFRCVTLSGIVLLGLASCNVAKMQARMNEGRLLRTDYQGRSFPSADGDHFTWYRDTGKEKLLLLHGYTGSGQLQWSRTAQLLADDYDLILPDLLSHGRSAKWTPLNGEASTSRERLHDATSMDAQVAHVVLILDSLGIAGPITVVGSSYGGGVAAHLAEQYPARVKKLIIYDGLVSDYSRAVSDSIARTVGNESMLAVMSAPTYRNMRQAIKLSLWRTPPLPGFILKQIYEENVRPYRPAQILLIQDLITHEDLYVTKHYDWPMPVYLIWGERDELIPNSTGLAIMRRDGIPADHWVTVHRTGHVANIERPKAFDHALREVLAR